MLEGLADVLAAALHRGGEALSVDGREIDHGDGAATLPGAVGRHIDGEDVALDPREARETPRQVRSGDVGRIGTTRILRVKGGHAGSVSYQCAEDNAENAKIFGRDHREKEWGFCGHYLKISMKGELPVTSRTPAPSKRSARTVTPLPAAAP